MALPQEADYPITFRAQEADLLGTNLKHHNSVVLIGMKRVGISNFLRFFLHHPEIEKTYIRNGKYLFVSVDLNDLIQRQQANFWILTLKRLVDTVINSQTSDLLKSKAQHLFNESIQIQDVFFTLEAVRTLTTLLAAENVYVTFFLIRFDRLQPAINQEFFANIQGLKEAAGHHLTYVFTSHRSLPELVPDVFTQASLSVFSRDMYLPPAQKDDMEIILQTLVKRYELQLSDQLIEKLIELSGGHVQYLQLSLIKLKYLGKLPSIDQLEDLLRTDEEIELLSEEIFETLTRSEQTSLAQWVTNKSLSKKVKLPVYLHNTGLIQGSPATLFNTIFSHHLKSLAAQTTAVPLSSASELTKKEHRLFQLLYTNLDQLVERDLIIQTVWPDQVELGVSDWALDRLIARLRTKLREQQSDYTIVTLVSRGYKLVQTSE